MNRRPNLLIAVLSTVLLAVGAVRAADKLDPLSQPDSSDSPDVVGGADMDSRMPTLPCVGPRSQT